MKILAFGDVVGRAGRMAIKQHMDSLRKEYEADFVIVNGENMAGGLGVTNSTLDEIFSSGVDAVTSGNHIWKHREIISRLEQDQRLLRPSNYPDWPKKTPGRGWNIYTLKDGRKLALLNLLGNTFMDSVPSPFQAALSWVNDEEENLPLVRLVDFHAEATSEKKTLGLALDGKVSAFWGTHTHVQTADAHILPRGTAYITDLGMCGVEVSSLGMDPDSILKFFLEKRPVAFKPAKGTPSLNGIFLNIDDATGKAMEISIIRVNCPCSRAC